MILELAIGAGLVAAGVWLARSMRRGREEEPLVPGTDPRPDRTGDEGQVAEDSPALEVGDVVIYATDELWLAGLVELQDEERFCRLYRTPGTAQDNGEVTWVGLLARDGRELALLSDTDAVPAGRVPDELPVGGLRLSLRRRGQARVRTEGEQLPSTSERAEYTVLGGPGGRVLIVVDFHHADRLALFGERVDRDMLDVLPGRTETT